MGPTADQLTDASAKEIRDAIETKRDQLGRELEALGDHLSPRKITRRLRRDSFIVLRHAWNRVLIASTRSPRRPTGELGLAPNVVGVAVATDLSDADVAIKPADAPIVLDERDAARLAMAMLVSGFAIGRFTARHRHRP